MYQRFIINLTDYNILIVFSNNCALEVDFKDDDFGPLTVTVKTMLLT